MARVSFTALVEEIVGKLAGSVFQDSYGGYQIRTRVSPRNPQSNFQQLHRGEFAYISALWRTLDSTQRQTFIDAGPGPAGGLNLFIAANVNLTLIEQPLISSYTGPDVPAAMPITIDTLSPGTFKIIASGSPTTVPTGQSLLVYATYEKAQTKIFTNPSQYSPIVTFGPGTDLSTATNITDDWIARYGQFTENKRICMKSVLINHSTGDRGPESLDCANETPISTEMQYLAYMTSTNGNAPTIVEISNTTTCTFSWTYLGDGYYYLNIGGTFDPTKLAGGAAVVATGKQCTVAQLDSLAAFYVQTFDIATGTHEGDILNNTLFAIGQIP